MKAIRRYLIPLAVLIGLSFFSVLILEGSHHHQNLESHQDCSLCSWQNTGSQAPSTNIPTILFFFSLFGFLFISTPKFVPSFVSFQPSGRAPPSNLL